MAEEFFDDDFGDPEKMDGFERVAPGRYHVLVDSITEFGGNKNDALVTDFQVIAGSNPAMKGRTHRDFTPMSHDKWARQKRFKLACCLGLTSVEAAKQAKANGTSLAWEWSDGVGRQMAITVEEDEFQGKVSSKTPFARHFQSIEDAKKEGVPINEGSAMQGADDDPFTNPAGGEANEADDDPFA